MAQMPQGFLFGDSNPDKEIRSPRLVLSAHLVSPACKQGEGLTVWMGRGSRSATMETLYCHLLAT